MRCVFAVAAGPRIGFGHLMRARALARALGVRPVVALRGGVAAHRAAHRAGCDVVGPGRDPCEGATVVVVDDPSPEHARRWVSRAKRRDLLTVSIHDAGVGHGLADLVVDGSVACPRRRASARLLSGPRFYLLDPHTSRSHPSVESERQRVLVALGGGAHVRRVASRIVAAISARCAADVAVAAGFVQGRRPPLPGGRWLESPRGLMPALASADVVVVAGGVTLYEACALGRPAVGMAIVAPQRSAIRTLAARGGIVDAGGPTVNCATAARVGEAVARLLADPAGRTRLARRARRVVDGRGAERVARRIRALVSKGGGRRA